LCGRLQPAASNSQQRPQLTMCRRAVNRCIHRSIDLTPQSIPPVARALGFFASRSRSIGVGRSGRRAEVDGKRPRAPVCRPECCPNRQKRRRGLASFLLFHTKQACLGSKQARGTRCTIKGTVPSPASLGSLVDRKGFRWSTQNDEI
jgi:hypothetical protein